MEIVILHNLVISELIFEVGFRSTKVSDWKHPSPTY